MQTLELDLKKIRQLAKQRENVNFRFRSLLIGQDSVKVDKIVHRLHDEIVSQIDCTKCGNCCNELTPRITEKEIKLLAEISKLSIEYFVQNFLEHDSFDDVKYLRDRPCKFLHERKCIIYPDRPEDCKSYPHTHKKSFISRTLGVIDNYGICPIVFNLFERLKLEYRFR